jgi:hypothetical protein
MENIHLHPPPAAPPPAHTVWFPTSPTHHTTRCQTTLFCSALLCSGLVCAISKLVDWPHCTHLTSGPGLGPGPGLEFRTRGGSLGGTYLWDPALVTLSLPSLRGGFAHRTWPGPGVGVGTEVGTEVEVGVGERRGRAAKERGYDGLAEVPVPTLRLVLLVLVLVVLVLILGLG